MSQTRQCLYAECHAVISELLHTFSLSICGSGGGTTIWLAGCVGTGAIRGAAGAGAGGSVSRASLGGRSLMGPSRIG